MRETEACITALRGGDVEGAWTLFIDRYRRLTIAVIRRYVTDADDVMDAFAYVCEHLRAGGCARLAKFDETRGASFATWIVAVERNLVVDWLRAKHGRSRPEAPASLSPLGRRIYEYVFIHGYSHREAQELARTRGESASPSELASALREANGAVLEDGPRVSAIAEEPLTDDVAAVEPHDPSGDTSEVEHAMRVLPADVQLAIRLYVVNEVPAADIAVMMGLRGAKAVYNKVYRGLAQLRDQLGGEGKLRER